MLDVIFTVEQTVSVEFSSAILNENYDLESTKDLEIKFETVHPSNE